MMTIEEMKKMVGTQFIYIMPDGITLPAIVAAFDPDIGFTCLATGLTDSTGMSHEHNLDKNGELCLIGVPKDDYNFLSEVNAKLTEIRDEGVYNCSFDGFQNPSCSF